MMMVWLPSPGRLFKIDVSDRSSGKQRSQQ